MNAPQLDLTREDTADGELSVVVLNGRLILETVRDFLRTMRMDRSQALILDMTRVRFLDSAGVGSLVQLFVHRRGLHQKFALVGLSEQAKAVMEVCRLLKLFPCYPSVPEARKNLSE